VTSVESGAAPGCEQGQGQGSAQPVRLHVANVSKRYGPVQALSGVGFDLCAGECLALAGENGSGKSTLARILAGAIGADTGSFDYDGQVCDFARPRDALDTGIALVSQEPTAAPHMSIAENVLLPRLQRATSRVRRRQVEEAAVPYLRRVGLEVDPGAPFATLRQGDRELAEIAKAIAVEPGVLILDEATTRLPDPERLFSVVDELLADGLSVIFITHRLREIRRLANRALVLRDGSVAGELHGAELTDEAISSMMVGRELSKFFHKVDVNVRQTVLRVEGLVTDRFAHQVSFEVRAGEIVGLAGLVGAGRSELLETIAGVRRARHGSVMVDARSVRPGSPRAAIDAGVGFVPEDRFAQGLVRGGSIVANLALTSHRALRPTDKRSERSVAIEAVRRYRIRCGGVDAAVGTLSGGNAQKVVLARSLAGAPRVLLLDEPTRGVDVGAKEEIYAIIGELVGEHTGVLMASSDLLELLGLCDRVLVLCEGELVGELDRQEATEETIALLSAGGRRR